MTSKGRCSLSYLIPQKVPGQERAFNVKSQWLFPNLDMHLWHTDDSCSDNDKHLKDSGINRKNYILRKSIANNCETVALSLGSFLKAAFSVSSKLSCLFLVDRTGALDKIWWLLWWWWRWENRVHNFKAFWVWALNCFQEYMYVRWTLNIQTMVFDAQKCKQL